MHEASKTQSDNIRDNKIHINIAFGGQSRYNVNSSKENQALRSSIWFSGAFNEQTVCEARVCECGRKSAKHEFASVGEGARSRRKSAQHQFAGMGDYIMRDDFFELMEANPVSAAIKDEKCLENC